MLSELKTGITEERILANVKVGMCFKANGYGYTVKEVYPYNAKCRRNDGLIESFNIGDFVLLGIEKVKPDKENSIKLHNHIKTV